MEENENLHLVGPGYLIPRSMDECRHVYYVVSKKARQSNHYSPKFAVAMGDYWADLVDFASRHGHDIVKYNGQVMWRSA